MPKYVFKVSLKRKNILGVELTVYVFSSVSASFLFTETE